MRCPRRPVFGQGRAGPGCGVCPPPGTTPTRRTEAFRSTAHTAGRSEAHPRMSRRTRSGWSAPTHRATWPGAQPRFERLRLPLVQDIDPLVGLGVDHDGGIAVTRHLRKAKSSTSSTPTWPTSGSGKAMIGRSNVSLPTQMPTVATILAGQGQADLHQHPAQQRDMPAVRGGQSGDLFGERHREQAGFPQRKRRRHNSITTPSPPTATSCIWRTYRPCTCAQPWPPQQAAAVARARSTTMRDREQMTRTAQASPSQDVATTQDGASWLAFLLSFIACGLSGVQLVVSEAHPAWSTRSVRCCPAPPDSAAAPTGPVRNHRLDHVAVRADFQRQGHVDRFPLAVTMVIGTWS